MFPCLEESKESTENLSFGGKRCSDTLGAPSVATVHRSSFMPNGQNSEDLSGLHSKWQTEYSYNHLLFFGMKGDSEGGSLL